MHNLPAGEARSFAMDLYARWDRRNDVGIGRRNATLRQRD